MKPISIIIPTYREPEYLKLCLESCIRGRINNNNQIIVVVDGYYEENKHVLEQYKQYIEILILEENQGLCRATNLGVYNAKYDWILIVNDDNVFDNEWDIKLNESIKHYDKECIISINQIEPRTSIFKPFIINNIGTEPSNFDLFNFWEITEKYNCPKHFEQGWTLPIFLKKATYLKLGGWDEYYPNGLVADWEFFIKAELSDINIYRTKLTHFYHFGSVSTSIDRVQKEQQAHEYFKYKWGYAAYNKLLQSQ